MPSGYSSLDSESETQTNRYSISYVYENPSNGKSVQYSKVKAYFQDIEADHKYSRNAIVYGRPSNQKRDQPFEHSSYGAELQFRSDRNVGNSLHQISYGLDFSESDNERERKVTNNLTGVTESLKETPDSTIQRTGIYLSLIHI